MESNAARTRLAWLPLIVAAVLNQAGTWSSNWTLAQTGQALFVPTAILGATVLGARWRWTTLGAFLIYWCGDLIPMATAIEWRDLAMLALFMVGHVLLIMGTGDRVVRHPTRARIAMIGSAAVAAVGVVAALAWAPWLAAWIAMYAAVMTILVGRLAGFGDAGLWGGIAFLASNTILGVRLIVGAYGGLLPAVLSEVSSSLTMLFYAVGLALIATTVARTGPQTRPAGVPAH